MDPFLLYKDTKNVEKDLSIFRLPKYLLMVCYLLYNEESTKIVRFDRLASKGYIKHEDVTVMCNSLSSMGIIVQEDNLLVYKDKDKVKSWINAYYKQWYEIGFQDKRIVQDDSIKQLRDKLFQNLPNRKVMATVVSGKQKGKKMELSNSGYRVVYWEPKKGYDPLITLLHFQALKLLSISGIKLDDPEGGIYIEILIFPDKFVNYFMAGEAVEDREKYSDYQVILDSKINMELRYNKQGEGKVFYEYNNQILSKKLRNQPAKLLKYIIEQDLVEDISVKSILEHLKEKNLSGMFGQEDNIRNHISYINTFTDGTEMTSILIGGKKQYRFNPSLSWSRIRGK